MAADQPHPYPKNVITQAVAAMLVYSGISLVALVLFLLAEIPWSWRTVLVVGGFLVTGISAILMIRMRPSQAHVAASLTVMGLSVLRVGEPYEWGWASWFIIVSTLILVLPLVRALLVMQQFDRMHGV